MRKIAAIDLPKVSPPEDLGRRPALRWVKPTDLLVDDTYQRELTRRGVALIEKMAAGFAWYRMKPAIVVDVGEGELHVIDGQHTAIAAASIGVPEIPVFIVDAPAVNDRARAFVGHNSDRVIVHPIQIHRALVAAGDPDAIDIDKAVKRAGARVRWISPNVALEPGDTMAIGSIAAMVRRRGVMRARQVLDTLVKAKRAPISAAEMRAVEDLICAGADLERLVRVIRVDGDDGILQARAAAQREKRPLWRVLVDRWSPRAKAA